MSTDEPEALSPPQRLALAYGLALAKAEQARWEASMQQIREAASVSTDEVAAMADAIRRVASAAGVSGSPTGDGEQR